MSSHVQQAHQASLQGSLQLHLLAFQSPHPNNASEVYVHLTESQHALHGWNCMVGAQSSAYRMVKAVPCQGYAALHAVKAPAPRQAPPAYMHTKKRRTTTIAA
jgi:hypothetical protein